MVFQITIMAIRTLGILAAVRASKDRVYNGTTVTTLVTTKDDHDDNDGGTIIIIIINVKFRQKIIFMKKTYEQKRIGVGEKTT